jgi:hypothetical protein
MKKLFYAAVAASLTLVSASPAFAQDVPRDLVTAIDNRITIGQDMARLTALTAGSPLLDEAVLGETALPVLGFDAPVNVQLDMLTALRGVAAESRGLGELPTGLSTD